MDLFDDVVKKLREGSDIERWVAAEDLGLLKDAKAVEPLADALKDGNWKVRMNAAIALAMYKDQRAIGQLIDGLGSLNEIVCVDSAKALIGIGEPAVEPLIEAHFADVRPGGSWYFSAHVLVEIGKPAVKLLVEKSRKTDSHAVRQEISEILERIDKKEKGKAHDFGCKETWVLKSKKVPDEFRKAMLKEGPVGKPAKVTG